MSTYTDQILDAVDILVNEKVSTLQFDQTVRATIKEVVDASIGKYKVSYQNSLLYAYSLNIDNTYSVGTQVYIEIPSNDFNKDIIIVGPVSKLGINYVTAIAPEDRVGVIGSSLINNTKSLNFCSYKGTQSIKANGISSHTVYDLYKDKCDTLVLAANFKTALPIEQQIGGGNYGLKVKCTYVNSAYKTPNNDDIITREYIFNVDNMEGQPYKYTLGSRQVALFPIDGVNLKSIDSIEAFCENFPNTATGKSNDIFISDLELYLGALYTEEELSGSSLRIIYPDGNIIEDEDSLRLKANLRIKGKAVNVQEQGIGFYWFKKDNSITSSSKLYSPYGGIGWSCLNPIEEIDGKSLFYVDAEVKTISESALASYKNIFKCVAIYNDNGQEVVLSAQGELYNVNNSGNEITISSSTGTNFSFNIGKTTLTCNKKTNISNGVYYWTQKIDSGVETPLAENTKSINVEIGAAAHMVEYSCTVYNNTKTINYGTGFITLVNENETKHGYTLIINNGTKVFKYDEYGVSPTSVSKAVSDRMVLETLTFDIYNELGQKINLTDAEKTRACNIKWVFPNNNTLLTTAENLINDNLINVTTNTSEERKVLQNKTGFTYGIENWYNEWKKNNNIQLEVDYLDQHLVASTNFTFTKEGELGTNGTKYIARIVPNNADAIVMVGTTFYGIKFNNNTVSFASKGTNPKITNLITAQLWNGGIEPVSASVSWSIADTTKRAGTPRLTISENNVKINSSGNVNCNILQATFTYDGKKFYATYPIVYTTGTIQDMPWLLNGYKEVMYESDGTRGKFNGLPFTVKRLYKNDVINPTGTVTVKGFPDSAKFGSAKLVNGTDYDYTLEPPSYFISETAGHYVSVTANSKTTYFPVQLYLNRYGMAAMNDWDGTSIEINNDGSYILAPQIGAGTKNNKNQFTGITMGEVFQASNNKQIGLFGYHEGAQSIFLDAETGNAHFGISGSSRINIGANKEGAAPAGSIYSGNYYTYDDNGKPKTLNNQGMLIDLVTPSIKFGTGNFEVNASGHITAKGGGSIAGWQIYDNELYSSNNKIYLNSKIPKIYGQENPAKQHHDTLTSSSEGFYLASDGLSIGSKFKVSSDGTIKVGKNAYDDSYVYNWEINGADGTNNYSYIKYGTPNKNGSVYLGTDKITLGTKFKATNNGVVQIGSGAVVDEVGGKYWTINGTLDNEGNSLRSYIAFGNTTYLPDINSSNTDLLGADNSVYLGTDGIRLGTKFGVDDHGNAKLNNLYANGTGQIGGWNIGATTLSTTNLKIDSGNQKIYSGEHNILASTEDGFYLSNSGLSIGSKFYAGSDSSSGVIRVGVNATTNGTNCWTISGDTNNNSYIKYGTKGNNNSVYLGTDEISLGKTFKVDNNGVLTSTSGHIGGWTISDTTLSNHNITLNAGTTKIGNETEVRRITAGSDGKFIVWDDGSIKSTSGAIGGWVIGNNDLHSSNETIYLDSNSTNSNIPKIYGQSDASKKHNTLTSSSNGFYLASDGLSIGSKFKVSSDGTIKVGKNAYNNNYTYNWEINGSDSANNSYIKYGTQNTNNSVYLGTDKITLGTKFYTDNNGVVRIGTNAVTNGNLCWTVDGTQNRSYIAYGATDYVPEIQSGSTNIGGISGSVYLGTEGIRLGTQFGVDNKGNAKLNNLYANGSGQIGGWTITSNTLESGKFKLTSSGNNTNSERININEGKFIAYNDGRIKATAGTIGGWNIGTNSLQAIKSTSTGDLTLTLKDDGSIEGPTVGGSKVWQIESNGIAHFKNVVIDNQGGNSGGSSLSWTNPDDGYTAFSVDKKGNLYARLANIAGNVEANSGHIGDVSITGGGIGGNSWSINNSGMNFGNMFYVDTSGYVTASNINATGGSIGGCAISNGTLQVGAANIGSCNVGSLTYGQDNIQIRGAFDIHPLGYAGNMFTDFSTILNQYFEYSTRTITIDGKSTDISVLTRKTPSYEYSCITGGIIIYPNMSVLTVTRDD